MGHVKPKKKKSTVGKKKHGKGGNKKPSKGGRRRRVKVSRRRGLFSKEHKAAPVNQALNDKILAALRRSGIEVSVRPGPESIRQLIVAQQQMNPSFTSLFVVNLSTVIRKYQQWVEAFPTVRPFYAVKSNPDPAIVRVLQQLGTGFDCASLNEIALVRSMGVPSKDIIFANPCKGEGHILYAKKFNVSRLTFDNMSELEKMYRLFPKAELVLRILPYDTSRSFSVMPFGRKFGASYEDSVKLLERAQQLGANVMGVSFHVGSGCYDVAGYVEALESSRRVFDLGKQYGFDMRLLDIGGGWPGGESKLSLEEMAEAINPLLESLFPGIPVISEPGRYFCTECSTLATVVTSKRAVRVPVDPDDEYTDGTGDDEEDTTTETTADLTAEEEDGQVAESFVLDEDEPRPTREERVSYLDRSISAPDVTILAKIRYRREWMYYVSDSVYGCFNNKIFDHATPHPFLLEHSEEEYSGPTYPCIIFGCTCDSIDIVCDRAVLPELEIGSWLFFPDMGAYTLAAASSFNGFEPPPRLYVF